MKNLYRAAVFAACIVLLSGCSLGSIFAGPGHQATPPAVASKPAQTAQPLPTQTILEELPTQTPTATPRPSAAPPVAYSFPMAAAGLFGLAKAPEGFARPVWLSGDGFSFLFSTADGGVFRARWSGSGYDVSPVAESISTGAPASSFVDERRGMLFCQGNRAFPDGGSGPCVVMTDLANGSRCNVDDYIGWKEKGSVFSSAFQYLDGLVLSEVKENAGGKLASTPKWAVADIAAKSYALLDLSGFREKNLPQWRETDGMKLALVAGDKLLAVCRAREPVPQATGEASGKGEAYYAFLLDMNGSALKSQALALGAEGGAPAILSGVFFSASPDGKYLLYGSAEKAGVFLFDVEKFTETMLPKSDAGSVSFLQWGRGGAIYYGLEGKTMGPSGKVYRTSAEEIRGGK